ncbi:MAG: hypothetical protein LBS53_10170 [Synergistaceae bacterium]|jgi:hypothetical protein|nr:hypothetical protein [Synergistaceae bacterium]
MCSEVTSEVTKANAFLAAYAAFKKPWLISAKNAKNFASEFIDRCEAQENKTNHSGFVSADTLREAALFLMDPKTRKIFWDELQRLTGIDVAVLR